MVPRRYMHLLCYVILTVIPWTRSELFTAIAEMEPLLETHQRIIDDLDHYVTLEERRLIVLKRNLEQYKVEQAKAMEDIPNYLGNPINAFTLIKRLTTDLDNIEQSIKLGTEFIKNVTINHKHVKYPTSEDLEGAAHALIRLQKTYKLNTTDLANGILNGVIYSTPMTTSDCFELAKALYTDRDNNNSLPWFMETLRKYKEEELNYFSYTEVLEYISFIHYLMDDPKKALEWTEKLLELEPNHPRARGNIPYYEQTIEQEEMNRRKRQRGPDDPEFWLEETLEVEERPLIKEKVKAIYEIELKRYEKLCRGEMELPAFYTKDLYCRYLTENHPFLKLAPIKMEYLYRNPDVIVFHEVLSDDEIDFLKKKAKPRFKRAVVQDPQTGGLVTTNYRISKSAWLRDSESPIVAAVSQRVADMSGLDLKSSEELQVVNYGIGGHYEPHYDFARSNENAFRKQHGNRIATVLFYMSEVAQGGATVFTRLGVSVFPIKGAALFWMNLHPSGEGDLSTRHAACPVLRGSKWVSNKWLHQSGQELLKPCGLSYQSEDFLHKIPRPISRISR